MAPGAFAARDLGVGWKLSPSINIEPGETRVIADIQDSGAIQQIWMTPTGNWRWSILRIYWDDADEPSVECPVGDFFASGYGRYAQISSLAICINPRQRLQLLLGDAVPQALPDHDHQHRGRSDDAVLPDQLHPDRCTRRCRPISTHSSAAPIRCPTRTCTRSSTASAVRVSMSAPTWPGASTTAVGGAKARSSSSWTATTTIPTICGTGTEDYFCGSYNFDLGKENGGYREFTTPYAGLPQVIRPMALYDAQTALRHVSLAHHGPDSLRAGSARHDPGAGLAQRSALPADAGRHRIGRLLVSNTADRTVPGAARPDYLEII